MMWRLSVKQLQIPLQPSVVIGRTEGGVERYLSEQETPDHRVGAILQFWGQLNSKKTFAENLEKFEKELSYRIRQDILVNLLPQSMMLCPIQRENLI